MDETVRERLLWPPAGPVDAVVDTDAFNEADDQFALAYLLKNRDFVRLEAIYAAPFQNEKAASPAEGMEKSREEILRVLSLAGGEEHRVYRGAAAFLPDRDTPVMSEAARDLVGRAMAHSPERPLYVLGIAAATDLASAFLLEPAIRDRVVVVWLGGSGRHRAELEEFNLIEDLCAAQVLFDSGMPLVQVPCWGVAEHFTVSRPELERWLLPAGPLCRYLAEKVFREMEAAPREPCWTKTLWDVTAAAWLLNREGRFLEQRLVPAPVPLRRGYDNPAGRHRMGYVTHVKRDALLSDLLRRLTGREPG